MIVKIGLLFNDSATCPTVANREKGMTRVVPSVDRRVNLLTKEIKKGEPKLSSLYLLSNLRASLKIASAAVTLPTVYGSSSS